MDVTILIGTYGDERWRRMGLRNHDLHRERFPDVPIALRHSDGDLADARNEALALADEHLLGRGWLCFLDADDELEPGYFDAMAAASGNDADELLAPAVRYGPGTQPMVFRDRNIDRINPCVIGTLIHRDMFDYAGGFWHERAWEDWSLFRRAWLRGARIVHVEDAVYRANSTLAGRNSRVRQANQLLAQIRESHDRFIEENP